MNQDINVKSLIGWIIVTKRGRAVVHGATLPIYWFKKTAIEQMEKLGGHKVKKVDITDFFNPQ